MEYNNIIEYEVSGGYALFTDPLTKCGGEKCTLPVPTYESLKGITSAIYRSREIEWVIDAVRIMNPIRTECIARTVLEYFRGGRDLAAYTYLRNVRYRVKAHFEPRTVSFDTAAEHRCYSIARRILKRGGRYPAFLGTRDCAAEINQCRFDSGSGYYDNCSRELGLMYHSICYSGMESDNMTVQMFRCRMDNGMIRFPAPEQCPVRRCVG